MDVMPPGAIPRSSVRGANTCRSPCISQTGRYRVVLSVMDNLVKGASGQAVQNMNIMFGFPGNHRLEQLALLP